MPPPTLPLGQLLIERGFLGEEQLAAALAQQAQTGAPLGEVLVDLGYVPAALIAQALATQHGGLLKTEYGFATGFANGSPAAPIAVPPPISHAPESAATAEVAPLRIVGAEPVAPPAPAPAAPVAAPDAPAPAPVETAELAPEPGPLPQAPSAEAARLTAVEAELATMRQELDSARQELDTLRSHSEELALERDAAQAQADEASHRVQELEHELELARAELAEASARGEAEGRLLERPAAVPEELWTRLERLDARLDAAVGQAEAIERARRELADTNERLVSGLAEQTRRCDELEAELARVREGAAERSPEPVDRHLAFVGSPVGYSLVERPGPPPALDTIVVLPEDGDVHGRHRVIRVGKANLPGVDAPCAYLLPID